MGFVEWSGGSIKFLEKRIEQFKYSSKESGQKRFGVE